MARPLWIDAGTDPEAIADHLDKLADTATRLDTEPRDLAGADRGLLHRAAIVRARRQLHERHGEKDRILAEEVRAIDDLVRTANLLVERLREWYALHAPEATRSITDSAQLARLVAEHGDREGVMAAVNGIVTGVGSDLDPADMAVLQGFAQALRAVHDSWEALERRVTELMEIVAPNVAAIAGPVIGARLIALSGSVQKLATVPTGTVQLYGAETALFRHIKEGTKPPKHGVLFQHPHVHQAAPWQRGAIAKAMSLQIALAAKADAFTGNDIRTELKERLDADIARIKRTRSQPPKRPQGRSGGQGGRGPSRGPGGRGPGGPRRDGPRRDGPRRDGGRDNRDGPRRGGKPGGYGGKPGGSGGQGGKPFKPKKKNKFSGGPARPPGGKQ